MSTTHRTRPGLGGTGRKLLAGAFSLGVVSLTSAGVYAGLSATATSTSSVSSGTLLLTLSKDTVGGVASAGLPETISTMAPGDVYNVYVNLNNTGSLASAAGMTLGATVSAPNALTNGSVSGEGLSLTITACTVAWSATGTCGGTTSAILASTAVSAIATTAQNLTNVGALAASSGQLAHLQFSLTLAGTETSTNGALPTATIQGLSGDTITWTFTEQQRAGVTTNA